ncbi:hypothetical protein OH76DRAFT_1418305 [Lentinus brumalis]|uniref:CxC1-like cysteine cluster associated with KDZ transposases domain-containing protein n=1 Tax=Lentinus brumalis TaxID=2498619 RepID=A0A371DAH3_9APHY|nr:hypothetical protein OH76DRAFT_1418305 [Polyporus brumalis]
MTRSSTRKGTSRRVTVARSVHLSGGGGDSQGPRFFGGPISRTLGLTALAAERERAKERLRMIEKSLGVESRKDLADLRREEHPDTDGQMLDDLTLQNDDGDDNWEDDPEAGEEAVALAIRDLLGTRTSRSYRDGRSWRKRLQNFDANWKVVLPDICKAYLQWRYGTPAPKDPEILPATEEFEVLDIYSTATTATITRYGSLAEDLVLNGYLGTAPLHPSLAISFKTLELFRLIRSFKASFSTEAFTKLLCYVYYLTGSWQIPYRRFYRKAIADSFDIYLIILRDVRAQVMKALGRDSPDWRPKNACPACANKLLGEEPATFDRMVVMDGNSSLKRVLASGGRATADLRVFEDDYFLPRDFVDSFANEVKSRQLPRKPDLADNPHDEEPGQQSDDDEVRDGDEEGDPTDGAEILGSCASNWKAAAADEKKRMWSIYEESGIFASACRHGLILWIADMVRSGELAKYGIAMTAKTTRVLKGKNMHGYDIGCEFLFTIYRSSIGEEFRESGSRFCVNSFHGYSHSYKCQVKYHPNRIVGMGLEDLETMERIFSASNQLASVTRYASPYRRRMLIALYFEHWDDEKYANLGQMMYNNYRQALDIIKEKTPVVQEALQALSLTQEDIDRFEAEEAEYFSNLRDEDPEDLRDVLYVEALRELREASEELKDTSARYYDRAARSAEAADAAKAGVTFLTPTSGPTSYDDDLSATRKLETRRRYLRDRVDRLSADVTEIEVRLGIDKRWEPTDEKYTSATKYIATRTYQRALGRLQRLVIQRLFELHKMNLAQTGYKARTYIAKNLQRRCKAIRAAVKAYNAAARALDPPRETIDWTTASHYNFIEEFHLLADTRNDLREKPWATPAVREVMRLSQRIARAHEEIKHVHRDLRRIHTWVRDEEELFNAVLDDLKGTNPALHGAVFDYWRRRRVNNARNMAYIRATYELPDFSGERGPGTRDGPSLLPPHLQSREPAAVSSVDMDTSTMVGDDENNDALFGDDDEADDEMSSLIEYVQNVML